MFYITVDERGKPTGFFSGEFEYGALPPTAVGVTETDYLAYLAEPGAWVRNPVNGVRLPAPPVEPTQEQIIADMDARLQEYYDSVARTKRYDTRYTCALRAGYPGPFQAEGAAFGAWMDTCNAHAYTVMDDCLAGRRTVPTEDELIAELPPMVWP